MEEITCLFRTKRCSQGAEAHTLEVVWGDKHLTRRQEGVQTKPEFAQPRKTARDS